MARYDHRDEERCVDLLGCQFGASPIELQDIRTRTPLTCQRELTICTCPISDARPVRLSCQDIVLASYALFGKSEKLLCANRFGHPRTTFFRELPKVFQT